MRAHIRILLAITVMSSSFSPAKTAFAAILEYANIHLGDDYMNGDCELVISDDEPYSHINSHCNLDKDNNLTDLLPGTLIKGRNLLGYEIGWPRSNPNDLQPFFWGLLTLVNPVANSTYCVRFGEWWGVDDPDDVLRVTFGHHSDSSKNKVYEGKAVRQGRTEGQGVLPGVLPRLLRLGLER
jgi:hypothetical protein